MSIRGPLQLERRINRSLAWRQIELSTYKFIVDSAADSPAKTLRRGGIVLLYSHWEGFIKEASRGYLELAAADDEVFSALKPLYQAMVLRSHFLNMAGSKKVATHSRLLEEVYRCDALKTASVRIKGDSVVTTRGNVNAMALKELIGSLGLDYGPFASKEKPVINRLVRLRHSIAHGEGAQIDSDDHLLLHKEVISLLDEFKDQILKAGFSKLWRR